MKMAAPTNSGSHAPGSARTNHGPLWLAGSYRTLIAAPMA